MLREGLVPPDQMKRVLSLLAGKTDEMARLIDEMLEAARLGNAGVEYAMAPVDLLEVIDDALTAMEPLLRDPHHLHERGERVSMMMYGDRRRLTMVFTNLIDNAVKYSPQGGDIDVSWGVREGRAIVRISDEGLGIDRRDVDVLFTRGGLAQRAGRGHDIVEQHRGTVAVDSEPGRGSTFMVTLPLDASAMKASSDGDQGAATAG